MVLYNSISIRRLPFYLRRQNDLNKFRGPFRRRLFYERESAKLSHFGSPWRKHLGKHVSNTEKLLRFTYFPDHIDKDGKLKVDCIACQDLAQRGWSIERQKLSTKNQATELIEDQTSRKSGKSFSNILQFDASAVRLIKDDCGWQAFTIFEDVFVDRNGSVRSGHTEVLSASYHSHSRLKLIRHELVQAINSPKTISDLYP